jgi:hypothetical protein
MVQNRTSVTVLALACLIFIGFSADGYSQPQSDTVQTPKKEQPPTVRQPTVTWPRRQAAGLQVIADLSVTPLTYTGLCPAVFTFKGQIYANRATVAQYKFIRSDGVHTEAKTLTFEKEGRQEVTYTWQVGDAAKLPSFSGAAVMQVVYPLNVKIQSNEAVFRGTCTGQGKPEPENPPGRQTGQQQIKPEAQNRPGQQTVQQGPPAAQNPFPTPTGQQKQPAVEDLFPQPAGQQGQPAVAFPPPPGQQGQPEIKSLFFQPTGQQGPPAMGGGDCVSFNPAATTVQQSQASWTVVNGVRTLFSFGVDKIEAENTLAVIKHYKMDQSCFVGHPRPSFHYMLAAGSSPVGPFPGEDCRSFNPATTNVQQMKGGWKVVDGDNALFDFSADSAGADQALAVIKKYGFTHACMMARGKVDFLYLRK